MVLRDPQARTRLEAFIAAAAGAQSADVTGLRRLTGGAIQENWLVDVAIVAGPLAGRHELVLRTDAPTRVAISHDRSTEFALLRAAYAAGVTVPEPLFYCGEAAVLGKPFYLMRRIAGSAAGYLMVKEPRQGLAERLGRELARIHGIHPPRRDLEALGEPAPDPAAAAIVRYRRFLDAFDRPHPVFEWGLRWLERRTPRPGDTVLCHRDFRTGNYMVEDGQLTGILDWEFAGWGDPHEDLAWFCCRSWRFGQDAREAGGIAPRSVFFAGYESEAGRSVEPERILFWEIMASIRWGIIALQQGDRFVKGGERSLDLALVGRRRPAECEWDVLQLIDAAEARG